MTQPTPEMERQILGAVEPIRRNKPEPKATITVQIPFDMDLELEDRAARLGIKKRDIIVAESRWRSTALISRLEAVWKPESKTERQRNT